MYQSDCQRYPKGVDGLKALIEAPSVEECSNWGPSPYIECNASFPLKVRDWWAKLFDGSHKMRCLVDAWGNAFYYQSSGDKYELLSYGADNKLGGEELAKDISREDL